MVALQIRSTNLRVTVNRVTGSVTEKYQTSSLLFYRNTYFCPVYGSILVIGAKFDQILEGGRNMGQPPNKYKKHNRVITYLILKLG